MDLDTTIKGLMLTKEALHGIFLDICNISVEDDVTFEIVALNDIREGDDYPGIRVSLKVNYPSLGVPLSVDVTMGDKITPREMEYTFKLLFDNRTISIFAYNLETILAEKIETVLSRSIANTRPRDFYDIYIIYTLRKEECNPLILKEALYKTAEKRGSLHILMEYEKIMVNIKNSDKLKGFWRKYLTDFSYASDVSFDDTCNIIRAIMVMINE